MYRLTQQFECNYFSLLFLVFSMHKAFIRAAYRQPQTESGSKSQFR